MAYKIKVKTRGEYVHVTIDGMGCMEFFVDLWKEVADVCRTQAARKVLCEGCLDGSGMTMDVHEYGRKISETGIPTGTKIAVVCNEESYRNMHLEERVATTMSPVFPKIFLDREEAVSWLTR